MAIKFTNVKNVKNNVIFSNECLNCNMLMKKQLFFNYEGTVTSINESFCQFTLDNKYVVSACDIFEIGKRGLPKLNETLILKNVLMLEHNYIQMSKASEISCSGFEYPEKSERFCWEYLEKHNFNFKDIELIQKTVHRFKKLNIFHPDFIQHKTLFQTKITVEDIFLNVYSYLPIKYETKRKYNCNFRNFDFVFPYKFSATYPEVYTDNDLEELTYTIQKNNAEQIFIGYLTYDKTLYSNVIIDAKHQILCQIINNSIPLHKYMNEFIIIKKYHYIVEYYKEVSQKLEYLLFNLDDVDILNLKGKVTDSKEELICNSCTVLHKCPVYYNSFKKSLEIWLYVEFPKNCFKCLISSPHFRNIYHLINAGTELIVNIPEDLNLEEYLKNYLFTSNIELNKAFDSVQTYVLPGSINIEINEDLRRDIKMFPIEDVINSYDVTPVSFIATIQSKGLSKPLSSRTAQKNALKQNMFGTTGTQTHFLRLEGVHNRSYVMTLYLNNLENSLCPIGLIPGMKLIVRLVFLQNSYLKSCVMTYFEPLEYKPKNDINTRIDFSEDWNWGEPTIISTIKELPYTARIWGHIDIIEIIEIKFNSRCVVCNELVTIKQKFCCGKADFTYAFKFKFKARDRENFSYITSDNLDVFKTIFAVNDNEVQIFLELLSHLRQYEYKPCGNVLDFQKVYSADPAVHLNQWFNWFFACNNKVIKNLDLRIKNAKTNNFFEQWYCAEARETKNALE